MLFQKSRWIFSPLRSRLQNCEQRAKHKVLMKAKNKKAVIAISISFHVLDDDDAKSATICLEKDDDAATLLGGVLFVDCRAGIGGRR